MVAKVSTSTAVFTPPECETFALSFARARFACRGKYGIPVIVMIAQIMYVDRHPRTLAGAQKFRKQIVHASKYENKPLSHPKGRKRIAPDVFEIMLCMSKHVPTSNGGGLFICMRWSELLRICSGGIFSQKFTSSACAQARLGKQSENNSIWRPSCSQTAGQVHHCRYPWEDSFSLLYPSVFQPKQLSSKEKTE